MSNPEPEFVPEDFQADQEGNLQPKTRALPVQEIKRFEKDRQKLRDAEAQIARLEREKAFAKAGVPDDAKGDLFVKAYDGELDPTAIRAKWDEIFPPDQSAVNASLAGHQAAAQMAAGAGSPDPGVDVNALMRSAKTKDELLKIIQQHVPSPDELGLTGRLQDR